MKIISGYDYDIVLAHIETNGLHPKEGGEVLYIYIIKDKENFALNMSNDTDVLIAKGIFESESKIIVMDKALYSYPFLEKLNINPRNIWCIRIAEVVLGKDRGLALDDMVYKYVLDQKYYKHPIFFHTDFRTDFIDGYKVNIENNRSLGLLQKQYLKNKTKYLGAICLSQKEDLIEQGELDDALTAFSLIKDISQVYLNKSKLNYFR